ncbi:MAG: hypothetical protein ACI9OU_000481 [Candidatus Promineifilaceae bacterium]|jgi:hypothetical protein
MMKPWQFFTVLLLAVLCVGSSIAAVLTTQSNIKIQQAIQARQAKLNSGVFSQKGQQIASNILQAMANASAEDASLRGILLKHGYTLKAPTAAAAVAPSTDAIVSDPVAATEGGTL